MAALVNIQNAPSSSDKKPLLMTRLLKSSIIITVILTVASVLVLVFPEKRQVSIKSEQKDGTVLTAIDRLQDRTGPKPEPSKTVGYTGTITKVDSDTMAIKLSNETNIELRLSNSTIVEKKIKSANPEQLKISALTSGQSVQVVAEPLDHNPKLKFASKIVVTN